MKYLFVNADGSVEESKEQLAGEYYIRVLKCPTCGADGHRRKYKLRYAHNINTLSVSGEQHEKAWGPPNDGALVAVEEPL